MRKEETSTFYTDLDTILDTRLGVLQTHYRHLFPSVLNNYQHRWKDEFEGISKEEFSQVYAMRGKRELQNSIKTGMLDILLEFACETNEVSRQGHVKINPAVEVNLYPYLLTSDDEKKLMGALRVLLNETCSLSFINEDPKDIGFDLVNERYSMMAMYHADKWLDHQCELDPDRKRFCPAIGLLMPSLVKDPEYPEFKKDPGQFFKLMSEHLSPIIRCQVLNVFYFNYKIPST